MSSETKPAYLRSSIIDELKMQEIESGIVPLSSLTTFSQGSKLKILHGPFKDQIATFESLTSQNRMELLIDFMGREVRINVQEANVSKI